MKTTDNKYDYAAITPEFLKANDGKLAWVRWDYLMCMGMVYESNRPMYDFLDHVWNVKKQAEADGVVFAA